MVAMKCRDQLHELVKEEIEKRDSSTEEWKIAMERSFNRMDNEVIARNDSKQSFRRNVVSLAVEHKEVRSRLASQVQSLALQTLTRQAEAKAKKMEDEMYRLQESLEERNCSFKHQHLLAGKKGWLIDRIEYMRISGGPWSTIGALRVHRSSGGLPFKEREEEEEKEEEEELTSRDVKRLPKASLQERHSTRL
ncbi:unnamed protein product [Camellia sinensis]